MKDVPVIPAADESQLTNLVEVRRVDHDILLITAVLWFANFGILATRASALGLDAGIDKTLIRFICSIVGAVSTLAVYGALRSSTLSPLKKFVLSVISFIPISFGLGAMNETVSLLFTNYYLERYNLTASQIFSGHCPGKIGCEMFGVEIVYTSASMIWVYIAWAALYVSTLIAADVRDRDRRLSIANAAAHHAQLNALRYQLNPHFLFNTLNTLSGLVALDRKAQAEKVILNLSMFLRRTLREEARRVVSLRKEFEAQQMYLDIEQVRFGDRLKVDFYLDPQCDKAGVPPFILQPLIENSIKHGVAPSERTVSLGVSARRLGTSQLELKVENSNPGPVAAEESGGFGIGLENVRLRLDAIYGGRASLVAETKPDGGWQNVVTIPWTEYCSDDAHPDR